MEHYETIISGASMVSLGIALCDPEHTLIIENGIQPAPEFYCSMRYDKYIQNEIIESSALELYTLFENKTKHSVIMTMEIMPELATFIQSKKIKILFDCTVLKTEKTQNGCIVNIISKSEHDKFHCNSFIDTTETALLKKDFDLKLTLNAFALYQGIKNNSSSNLNIGYDDIYLLQVPVNKDFTYPELRKDMMTRFKKETTSINNDTLLKVADRICIRATKKTSNDESSMLLYSAFSNNIISALQNGIFYWRKYLCTNIEH